MKTGTKRKAIIISLISAFFVPVFAFADETITFSSSHDSSYEFGRSGDVEQIGNYFTLSANESAVTFHLKISYQASGHPDDLTLYISSDNAGDPSGTVLTSVTIPYSSLSVNADACAVTTIDIPVTYAFTAGVTYWVVLDRGAAYQANPDTPIVCVDSAGTLGSRKYAGNWAHPRPSFFGTGDFTSGGGGGGGGTIASSTDVTTASVILPFLGILTIMLTALFVVILVS